MRVRGPAWINKSAGSLLQFCSHSGVVQLVAHGPLEPRILVRVQAPEPSFLLVPAPCTHPQMSGINASSWSLGAAASFVARFPDLSFLQPIPRGPLKFSTVLVRERPWCKSSP